MTCGLEHIVEGALHLLPDGVAVRFDDHTASDGRIFCQIGTDDQFVVPLGIVLGAFYKIFCHFFLIVLTCECVNVLVGFTN